MTALLNINTIEIPEDRQRFEGADKHIKELVESISRDGLINPITVTKDRRLVAGFCRLSAVRLLSAEGRGFVYDGVQVPPGQIPVLLASSEEPRILFRIELEENLRRKNLSPAENAKAIARLHEFFKEQFPTWSQQDTADKLVEHDVVKEPTTAAKDVSRNLLIASFADDEDVRSAKTEHEAYKLARKKSESLFTQVLGELLTDEQEESPEYFTLFEGSYRDYKLPESPTYNCILVDPPYGIGADSFGDQTGALDHTYKDDSLAFFSALQYLVAPELIRACHERMHLFMFLDIRQFSNAAKFLTEGGYYVWPTPLIWVKNAHHLPQPDLGPRRCYESILFASRGRKPVLKHGSDVLVCNVEPNKLHAAQKPVALYQELLSWSIGIGDHVLDFCCGSGTIFEACKDKRIYATGIESDPLMAKIARTRM